MKLDLKTFLENIKNIPYILIKMDVPYMPKDFPNSYPNKDMDIIVNPKDFERMKHEAALFSADYSYCYCREVIIEDGSYRIRFYGEDDLFHYQIDVSCKFFNLPKWFIEESIQKRKLVDAYYVTLIEYEIIYRLTAFINKHKKWHLDYVKANKVSVVPNLLTKVGLLEKYNRIIK